MLKSLEFPIGVKADVKELEYISALHQTCHHLRKDATISATDITLFLRSRYGLNIEHADGIDIIRGLGGTLSKIDIDRKHENSKGGINAADDFDQSQHILDDGNVSGMSKEDLHEQLDTINDDEQILIPTDSNSELEGSEDEYLDLVQVVSAIIIPTLMKAREDNESKTFSVGNAVDGSCETQRQDIRDTKDEDNYKPIHSLIIRDVFQILIQRTIDMSQSPSAFDVDHFGNVKKENRNENIPLTNGLIRNLLLSFGEVDAASDNELIEKMITCATASYPGTAIFDETTFLRALTVDVIEWQCCWDHNISTPFYDVFECDPKDAHRLMDGSFLNGNDDDNTKENQDLEENSKKSNDISTTTFPSLNFTSTSPSIDYVVDSFYSTFFVMALWVFYIYNTAIYVAFLNSIAFDVIKCGESFGCKVSNRIWSWASFALILTMGGLLIIVPISISNDPYGVRWNWALLSALVLSFYSGLPLLIYETGDSVPKSWTFDRIIKVYLAFGTILLVFVIPKNVLSSFTIRSNEESIRNVGWVEWFTLSSDLTSSAAIKSASSFRINQMLDNAVKIHFKDTNEEEGRTLHTVQSMERYLLNEDRFDFRGGLVWSWKQLLMGNRLLKEHGIWLHCRLAIGQEGQIIAFFLFFYSLIYITEETAILADADIAAIVSQPASPSKTMLLHFLPSGSIIRISLYTGGSFAAVIGILLILLYLPSTCSTILKLRCGMIASLHDEHMNKYRSSADTICYNISNMMYGLVGAMTLFLTFFGGIIFLFLWNPTNQFMMSVLAWGLGLTITMTVKTVLVKICRKAQYQSFYRKRPRSANLVSLAMECWTLGVAGGALVGRLTQFLLASAFWIGRIDVNYLDDDVNLLGYRFDTVPTHYRKEILAHDAHRHPILDRLAFMYLLRLKHKEAYCTDAGCAWRRIFIQALMPWLMKYRQEQGKNQRKVADIRTDHSNLLPTQQSI